MLISIDGIEIQTERHIQSAPEIMEEIENNNNSIWCTQFSDQRCKKGNCCMDIQL